jgi:uncharacterized membrane protein
MAKDIGDTIGSALGTVAREAAQNMSSNGKGASPLSGMKGIAAGAGLGVLAPIAGKKLIEAVNPKKMVSKAADQAGDKLREGVGQKVDEAGGVAGIAKEAGKGMLPSVGDDDNGGKGGMPGVGEGRRMPVQQAIDVAVPVETAYNQWTQFEDWPEFMHRVTRVTQEDDCTVSFATKIWGKTKEFEAEIETQRPDQRIQWRVSQGITHTGVVTFHELSERLTRIEVSLDVDPGSLIEKAARGMRHIKRAVRGDLHRFKAFVELQELETGAWRGVIEEGEVVDPHDEGYDDERDYSEVGDLLGEQSRDGGSEDEEEEEEEERPKRSRSQRSGQSNGRSRTKTRASSNRSRSSASSKRSSGNSKRSSGNSKRSSGNKRSSGSRSKSGSRG